MNSKRTGLRNGPAATSRAAAKAAAVVEKPPAPAEPPRAVEVLAAADAADGQTAEAPVVVASLGTRLSPRKLQRFAMPRSLPEGAAFCSFAGSSLAPRVEC